jgi:hypothetical protein
MLAAGEPNGGHGERHVAASSDHPAGLHPGVYQGFIDVTNTVVTATGTSTSNNDIPVTLNVSKSPLMNWTPSSLIFSFQTPQLPPVPETINLSSTLSSLPFTVAASTVCGTRNIDLLEVNRGTRRSSPIDLHSWFHVSPIRGGTEGTASVPITVSLDPTVVTRAQNCSGYHHLLDGSRKCDSDSGNAERAYGTVTASLGHHNVSPLGLLVK